mmetsp:Transcript_4151/g.17616  ORF Transcript_4151/g.17616 Transcript_4151/m.17616 type:complete len:245 (+) Transcript_4151:1860-2594(+)
MGHVSSSREGTAGPSGRSVPSGLSVSVLGAAGSVPVPASAPRRALSSSVASPALVTNSLNLRLRSRSDPGMPRASSLVAAKSRPTSGAGTRDTHRRPTPATHRSSAVEQEGCSLKPSGLSRVPNRHTPALGTHPVHAAAHPHAQPATAGEPPPSVAAETPNPCGSRGVSAAAAETSVASPPIKNEGVSTTRRGRRGVPSGSFGRDRCHSKWQICRDVPFFSASASASACVVLAVRLAGASPGAP